MSNQVQRILQESSERGNQVKDLNELVTVIREQTPFPLYHPYVREGGASDDLKVRKPAWYERCAPDTALTSKLPWKIGFPWLNCYVCIGWQAFFSLEIDCRRIKEGAMPRKGENIYKRKDGRWEGRYIKYRKEDGMLVYGSVYGRTYTEVKCKKEQMLASFHEKSEEKEKSSEIYIQDLAQKWLESIEIFTKESTINKYRNIVKNHIYGEITKVPMEKVTAEMVQAHCNLLLREGGKLQNGLEPKTVADTLSVLRLIFRYAAHEDVKVNFDLDCVKIKQKYRPIRVLSCFEQRKLIEILYSNLNGKNIGMLISLYTGLRIGEVCALRWEHISFDEQIMKVRHTMQRIQKDGKSIVAISTPKSECSIRDIPIPAELVRVLKEYQCVERGYLITNSDEKYVEPRTMQNHYKRIEKCCPFEGTSFHTLRHTFATRSVEVGFDIKSLSEILGHSSVNITLNRYVHPSMELKASNMQKMDQLYTRSG